MLTYRDQVKQKKVGLMKKIYLLPNVITALGLSCGLFAIFKTNMIEVGHVNQEILITLAGILILAAFADVLDGTVARVMKADSEFGGVFDCLSDGITFGVAPSVIILKSLSLEIGSFMSMMLTVAVMIYAVCGVLRLVRFQVDSGIPSEGKNKHFTGLPIPMAAAAALSGNLLLASHVFQDNIYIGSDTRAWLLFGQMVLLGYFMVSRWKFPSVKTLRIRVVTFQQVFIIVLFAVLILYGILHQFVLVFFGMSWGYLVLSWSLSLARIILGKKSRTLESFEPEPELESDPDDREEV